MNNYFSKLAFLLLCEISIALTCPRILANLPHGRRSRGDNGYKLIVADSADGYTAGKTYNILLTGAPSQYFTHFTISLEATRKFSYDHSSNPQRVGRFQLFSDGISKFNEHCVNTVMEADNLPKTRVQVMWIAPESGAGCVSLSAMVYEGAEAWFSDNGQLTQILCERMLDTKTSKKCCASSEAKYSFLFKGIWSIETHPKDYPFAIWLTHFSDIIGASHDNNFSFWGENHIATDAFRSLAEWGSSSALERELRGKGSRLRTLIKAPGLWYPRVNTFTTSQFRVDGKHPKVSLVSMFGPSPDWVVGINGIDLCTDDCSWKESVVVDLYPWDAGTDSGISYMSPNIETQPRERMYRITTMYPEDPRAPFYNPGSTSMIPLAKVYISREKISVRNSDKEFLRALHVEDKENRAECEVGEYSDWSPCSATCAKGIRMRNRQYLYRDKAEAYNCTRQLISKEMCVADIPECGETRLDDDDDDLAYIQTDMSNDGDGAGICQTTPWSTWSECSVSCGIGITMRTRTFINHLGRKRCPHILRVQKEKCMRPDCTFEELDLPDPNCPTTQWSDWSPCTATCNRGVTIRTRLLLIEGEQKKHDCKKRIQLYEQMKCNVNQACSVNIEAKEVICSDWPDTGPCRGSYLRYAYNKSVGICESFIYGGCRGNSNNFLTENDCLNTCSIISNF